VDVKDWAEFYLFIYFAASFSRTWRRLSHEWFPAAVNVIRKFIERI